jgi:hypothetical protein
LRSHEDLPTGVETGIRFLATDADADMDGEQRRVPFGPLYGARVSHGASGVRTVVTGHAL